MTRQSSRNDRTAVGRLGELWQRYEWAIDYGYRASPWALSLYRVGFALYLLIARPVPALRWMANYPEVFYSPPPGLPTVWRGVLPEPVLLGLELGLLAAIVMLLLGWRTTWSSLAVGVGGLLVNSVYFSFGKIEHTILLWLVPIVFSVSGWGAALSLDARAGRAHRGQPSSSSRAIFITGVLVAISYLTAAVPKILGGWLSPGDSGTQLHFLLFHHQLGRDHFLADFAAQVESRLAWEALDWGTVIFEVLIGFTLLWPAMQRRMIFVAWTFHLSVLLIMNIGFIGPLPVYPVFFLPLLSEARARAIVASIGRRLNTGLVAASVTALFVLAAFFGGLWPTFTADVLGVGDPVRDLTFMLTGYVILLAIAVVTRGYRSPDTQMAFEGRDPEPATTGLASS